MRVSFGNDFNTLYGEFGIRQTHIENAIAQKDSTDVIKIEGLPKILIFSKRIETDTKKYELVVGASEKNENEIQIAFAFKIPFDNLGKSPLNTLENLSRNCGMEITIGGEKSRFFLKKSFPLSGFSQHIENPLDHDFLTSFLMAKTNKSMECAVAFCIDKNKYLEILKTQRLL